MAKKKKKVGANYKSKVCRLCQSKEGPFFNIFDPKKITAKQIEELMPFKVAEDDGLPHDICFRCSAKVEEMFEFVQKCIKTRKELDGVEKAVCFSRTGAHMCHWQNALTCSKLVNHDICDTIVERRVDRVADYIIDIKKQAKEEKLKVKTPSDDNKDKIEASSKTFRLVLNRCDQNKKSSKTVDLRTNISKIHKNENNKQKKSPATDSLFNIMDHVSTIKVNGVGLLYQCNLCNRNFVQKDILESHLCVKNAVLKQNIPQKFIQPEPPKPPTVKYITTKFEKKSTPDIVDINRDNIGNKPKPIIGPASKIRDGKCIDKPAARDVSMPQNQGLTNQPSATLHRKNFDVKDQVVARNIAVAKKRANLVGNPNIQINQKQWKYNETTNVNSSINSNIQIISAHGTDLDGQLISAHNSSRTKPYPVGLFQTVPKLPAQSQTSADFTSMTAPVVTKPSYKIIRTNNANKFFISTLQETIKETVQLKHVNKSKSSAIQSVKSSSDNVKVNNPPKDPNYFTFINVDPQSHPSYVLPTNNILDSREFSSGLPFPNSQPSGSNVYPCTLCDEIFSREAKLSVHIKSHYSRMEED